MSYADYELINISSVDDIYSIIDSIKQKADSWCTNFCINKVKLMQLAGRKQLSMISSKNSCLIFWKRSRDYQVYYFSIDLDDLKMLLQITQKNIKNSLVINLLNNNNMDEYLLNCGFKKYCTLHRMVKFNREIIPLPSIENYQLMQSDAEYIYKIMAENLDIVSDQLPDIDEIKEAISVGEIIGVRSDITGKVASLIWFSVIGKTLELKYWLTAQSERGNKYGREIYSVFDKYSKGFKRIFLFCHENVWAAKFYERNNFKVDKVCDDVYVCKYE